jgi:hypothetical protein
MCSLRHVNARSPRLQVMYFQWSTVWRVVCHSLRRRRRGTPMQALMGGVMLIEATLLSFLLALCLSWMVLRGLFRIMPLSSRSQAAPMRPAPGTAPRSYREKAA